MYQKEYINLVINRIKNLDKETKGKNSQMDFVQIYRDREKKAIGNQNTENIKYIRASGKNQ